MNNETAMGVLKPRLDRPGERFSADELFSLGWYLGVGANDEKATLDGEFTADELEAIAAWMRDPSGVRSGKQPLQPQSK
jgi:hypothetical protein